MRSVTHGFSPVLPGAWASTWSLSPEQGPLDIEKTPRLANSQMPEPYSVSWRHHENPGLASSEPLNPKGLGRDAAHADDDADAISFADDDSSVTSEDFYSFISHQDTDTTLLPSSVTSSGSLTKEMASSDGLLGPLDFSGSHFDSSELGSRLHMPTEEDILASDVLCSLHETPDSADIHLSDDDDESLALDIIRRPTSPLGFTLPNLSACGQQLTASMTIDIDTRRMSSGSLVESSGYECDSASVHSDYSDINYVGISNLITRLDANNASQGSDISWSQSSSPRAARNTRWRDDNDNDPPLNSQPSTLLLSQPDGDSPWTLFLDPTLTPTESEAVSRSSATSSSLDLSFAPEADRASVISQHTVTSDVSLRPPFTPSAEPFKSAIPTSQQGMYSSVYGTQEPLEAAFIDPGPSTVTINPHNDSVRPKNFIQKTKNFCSKFKKLITLKAKKERRAAETQEVPTIHRTPLNQSFEPKMPPPLQQFPQIPSPSFSPVERPVTFQRTAKTSSPSVALSYTPEYTVCRSIRASDERLTYEYHARPKTLQEIRSKRRFSLPAFAGPSSSSGPSTAKIAGPSSPPARRRKAGSILSAEGRTMR